jgi:hypothetical protein
MAKSVASSKMLVRTYIYNVVAILSSTTGRLIIGTLIGGAEAKSGQSLGHDADITFFINIVIPLLHMMAALELDGILGNVGVIGIIVTIQNTLRSVQEPLTRARRTANWGRSQHPRNGKNSTQYDHLHLLDFLLEL